MSTDALPPALQGCRPCKMFSRKYQRMAEQFQECIFLDIVGDESTDTRVSTARPWSNDTCRYPHKHSLPFEHCLGRMYVCTGSESMVFLAFIGGRHWGGHLHVLASCGSLRGVTRHLEGQLGMQEPALLQVELHVRQFLQSCMSGTSAGLHVSGRAVHGV